MIRWLVVGAGGAARSHLAAIDRTKNATLAGVVAPEGLAGSNAPVFRDLAAALAAGGADAAIIASPHDTHLELGLACLRAGLPTLVEKPAGRNAADAETLAATARTIGVPCGIVLNQRSCRANAWLRAAIAGGSLRVRAVTIQGVLGRLGGWHAEPGRGSGLLRTVGIHYVDLLRWWLGEPLSFTGELAGNHVDDRCGIVARFPREVLATMSLSAVAPSGAGPVRISIEGDGARVEMAGHRIVATRGIGDPPETEVDDPEFVYGPGHLAIVRDSTAALSDNGNLPLPIADALPSIALVDRIYGAAQHGLETRTSRR